MEHIIKNKPFSDAEIVNDNAATERLYMFLFAQQLSPKDIAKLSVHKNSNDRFELVGRDLYVLFDQSIRNSRLANALQKMEVPVTSRNMKTISKLIDIGKQQSN